MLRSLLAVTALILANVGAPAATVSLDFNDLPSALNLTNQYAGVGATFSLIPTPLAPASPVPPPSGPTTWSLGPVNQFGVNGTSIIVGPTTNGPFYDAQVDFSAPVDYFSIVALDAETLPLKLKAFSNGTDLPLTFTSSYLGNISQLPYVSGPTYLLEIGSIGGAMSFDRVVFGNTEQFDNIKFNTGVVPLPTALWLFSSALGVMGWARRKSV
jgi:hypothetical protein